MCGRNSLFPPAATLEDRFDATIAFPDYRPRYNIAPSQRHPVIQHTTADQIHACQWGFRPAWATESRLINARSETAAEKLAFADAWEHRPCLIPSTGFYEWQTQPKGPKRPYRIYREPDAIFSMAGLWEPPATEHDLSTMTILTTTPNETLSAIHDRMPVVLHRDQEERWLYGDPTERAALCEPYDGDDLKVVPISREVNDPGNDYREIIDPIDNPQTGLGEFTA